MRKGWNQYFIDIAKQAATRATCPRKHVGCVLVREKNILATGYNGSMIGDDHCEDVGCLLEHNHCMRVVHAECNSIANAARHGIELNNATAYVTCSPCWNCFKTLINAGVQNIYFEEFYRDKRIFEAAKKLGVNLTQINENGVPISYTHLMEDQ